MVSALAGARWVELAMQLRQLALEKVWEMAVALVGSGRLEAPTTL